MSQSPDNDDGSQRSVAELIARYGGSSTSGGRRHRRAADADETAQHPAVGGVGSSAEPTAWSQRTGRRRAPEPVEAPPVQTPAVETPFRPSRPYRSSLTSSPPAGGDLFTAGGNNGAINGTDNGSRTEQLPRIEPGPVVSPSPAPLPPRPDRPRGPHRGEPPAGLNGSATKAEPRVRRDGAVQRLRSVPAIEETEETSEEPPEEPPEEPLPPAPSDEAGTGSTEDIAAADRDDEHPGDGERVSAVREWAVVAAQVGGGVIGGAVLWLACEWLWQAIPVLALIVALAVITGLVWVVRRVRRAEDLQTTVVAVLVGLFVTVSPAALLLVGR